MKQRFSNLFQQGQQQIDKSEEKIGNEEVKELLISEIVPNRYQPRTVFDDDKIEDLSQTIKTHGIIQPIVVRKIDDKFEIIAGERRFRAVTKLGWEKIPAIIKDFDDKQTASVALIENIQREELSAFEEALAYDKLLKLHGLTQEALAQRLGKGQSTIANKLRLLKLPQLIQDAILSKKISERHARALIPLKETELQEKVLGEILEKHLNVKQTEDRVKQLTEKKEKPKQKRRAFSRDTRLAINTVRQSIGMVKQTGLSINTDEEEFEDFYQFTIKIPK
ncbi:nucleoid occlusion protein [Lottiidibacillus patelloidae]|uniref:Nucleoid occlusion protein n=1 Tax=Lottiidibacillus patelloidae TaxID=2670334 RepID=A0A263BS71_9BACI|nr:nucleoid occlusion protein [Lottiidibacillus patelloidae]OZM56571.1 nucleoid occlusion protein [Lottiidibacillus patelloidae]